jgi:short-subunit dehydrogenase
MKPGRNPLRRVLLLGATSAIAQACAALLAETGAHLYLVARNAEKLEAMRCDLLLRGAASVTMAVADLKETALHRRILLAAARALGEIDLALIAYGVLGDQQAAEEEFRNAAEVLHTNFISAASLLTWLANFFETQKRGTLAVITSVAGCRARKSNYVYGASKGALDLFLDGIRNRIDRAGVQVLSIRPGFVDTPMTAHLPKNPLFASPETVALGILHAVLERRDVVYLPAFWGPLLLGIRAIPRSVFKRLNL